MPTGKLKLFLPDKGFGFITPDDGGARVFAHKSQFSGDEDKLRSGKRVFFEVDAGEDNSHRKALDWSLIDGGGGPRCTGRLKNFMIDQGYGFIIPDDDGDDVFAHSRQFDGDVEDLREGDRVSFELEWDEKRGKNKAGKWSLLDDSDRPAQQPVYGMPYGPPPPGYGAPPPGYGMPYGPAPPAYGPDPRYSPYGAPPPWGAPRPSFAAAPLPPEWEEIFDPASRMPFYRNRTTGQTTWTRPGPAAPGPSDWEQIHDPASGRPYYRNRITGQTTWTPPNDVAPAAASAGVPPGLPADWEQLSDPASGKSYYRNRSTGQTTWTPPQVGAPPEPARPSATSSADWETLRDPASGRPYYRNRSTGQTTWTPPSEAGAPAAARPPLPADWEQLNDPASGRPYFRNRSTGQTTWTAPSDSGAPAAGPPPAAVGPRPALPQDWEQLNDPASGKPYYRNRSTGQTTWSPPSDSGANAAGAPPAAAVARPALPSDWEELSDPASGKPYYRNRSTGQTTWTPPHSEGISGMLALPAP